MPVFQNVNGRLKKLRLLPLDKEKALQKLVEENLLEVLDMGFISSEYQTTHGGRIDTLAIDSDGAPVIIEYKRNRNDNVINQALSYLKWLKAQKVEFFEMLVTKKLGPERAAKINWHNPRVICIAESYSKFDIDTLEVVPLRLELYKFRYYENNIFSLENVNGDDEKPQYIQEISID
ncbi:MAG TPA: endonuclease NucS domain-containing protein, partial [Mucilaginibacter sp.]